MQFPSPQLRILGKSSISRRGTHWLLGHRSEEIYALHSQQWRHIRLIKLVQPRPYISTVSIDKISAGPLHLVLSARTTTITRRLKKPASYLSTMITIRVEMTPLITQESHSDYQPTSILTHANSATTTIPWLSSSDLEKLPSSISQDAHVLQYRCDCENSFRMRKCLHHRIWPRQSIKKRGSIVFASDRKWEVLSERAIGEGETPFSVVRLPS